MQPRDTAEEARTARAKILVVNDTPDFLDMMRDVLEGEGGYEVATLDKSAGVVEEVSARPPDLLIIDILFREGRRGLEIVDELAARAATTRIPVLFCTALSRSNIADEVWDLALARGHRVLFKPFALDDLLRAVAELLEGEGSPNSPLERAGA